MSARGARVTSGQRPNYRSNASAAWWASIPGPSSARKPCARADLTSGVRRGHVDNVGHDCDSPWCAEIYFEWRLADHAEGVRVDEQITAGELGGETPTSLNSVVGATALA